MTNTTQPLTPATIVFETSVGFTSIKVQSVKVTVRPFAQYKSAIEIRYMEQGKRTVRGTVLTDSHAWVILAGHHNVLGGQPECTTSYAPHHSADMDAAIRATGAEILRDFRTHNPHA